MYFNKDDKNGYSLMLHNCICFLISSTVREPNSKFIVQNPTTKQWQSAGSWHFISSQQVYLACQTYTGLVLPIVKISGPTVDEKDVRFA